MSLIEIKSIEDKIEFTNIKLKKTGEQKPCKLDIQ